MNEINLSIVIPTYNRQDSLRKTLDGLARQTYPCTDFEVVVVSDGSTDGTDALLTEYARTSPYALGPIRQANGGPARARNRGVAEARGAIIVFLDDDVEPDAEFLARHAAHHQAQNAHTQDKEVAIGPMLPDLLLRWHEAPWIAWEHAMLEKQYTAWRTGEWAGCGPNHFYSGNASLRREHLLAVGGFDENFPRQEDVELAYRLEKQCDVHFVFDAGARGIHRPQRRFDSWLAVPYAYGELDIVRARRGDIPWKEVTNAYHKRNRLTRMLACLTLAVPCLASPLRSLLLLSARAAYRLRQAGPAFAALSAIYNLRYLEGSCQELGDHAAMRRIFLRRELPPLLSIGTKTDIGTKTEPVL